MNKEVIKYCPNFYKITEFVPMENDVITEKILKIYQEYIYRIDLNNMEDVKMVQELDYVIGKYIEDYIFRKAFQKQIVQVRISRDVKDMLKEMIKSIIKIFNKYEEDTTKIFYVSHWI